jgi:hypothetical protein
MCNRINSPYNIAFYKLHFPFLCMTLFATLDDLFSNYGQTVLYPNSTPTAT